MLKLMIVGGTFDNTGGKSSHFVDQIAHEARQWIEPDKVEVVVLNGGNLSELDESTIANSLEWATALLWMPNIDNSVAKILPTIKKKYPALVLIQSKRVIEKEYSDFDIIKRLLASHAALGLKITKEDDTYQFTILDPLGNAWAENTTLSVAIDCLMHRLDEVSHMTRVRSSQRGDVIEFELEDDFLAAVKQLGEEFTMYVNAVNPERYLGNASTRCCYGFPSKRSDRGTIYMSKRNVDKTIISNQQFVEVTTGEDGQVDYFGEHKPSVDTPIQLRLYNEYPNVNYMVHGHVYVDGAPSTAASIPCGFLEEVDEILTSVPDREASNFVINLRGHGCLIMANTVEFLTAHQFVTRPVLETH